jgi:hypothetical protein
VIDTSLSGQELGDLAPFSIRNDFIAFATPTCEFDRRRLAGKKNRLMGIERTFSNHNHKVLKCKHLCDGLVRGRCGNEPLPEKTAII